MGLADRLAEQKPHHAAGCAVGKLLARLDVDDPDEATALRDSLAADVGDIGNVTIATALKAEGLLATSSTTVGDHRHGHCKCDEAGLR